MSAAPLVIAHRGASGYLPEHSREAKTLAYGQGADYLEQDVVATRDGHLVVLHDPWLDEVTDVAVRFPERRREDGRHYVIDFELEELLTLRLFERRRPGTDALAFPERFSDTSMDFRIVTFDEEIRLVRELNRLTGRRVGLYPEIKAPRFHRRHGVDLAARILDLLERHGYARADDSVVVQCFEADELKRCRHELGSALKLTQLVEPGSEAALEPARLAEIAAYAQAVAPHYSALVRRAAEAVEPAEVVREAGRAGLELHPFTFRRDQTPPYFADFDAFLEFVFDEVGAGAVFCDHPDAAVRARDRRRAGGAGPPVDAL